jgi:hypothetical protein
MSSKTPNTPDPYKVAQAQTAADIGTAIANSYMGNADTYGPLGSTTYNKTGEKTIHVPGPNGGQDYKIPTWSVQQKLSDDQQRLLNLQESTGTQLGETALTQSKKIGDLLNTTINENKLPDSVRNARNAPGLQTASGLTPDYQKNINAGPIQTSIGANDFSADRDKVVNALFSRLNPQTDRDRATMETKLANQGVTQGSSAYNNAFDAQNRQINDLRMQAVLAGGQEQSRLFGMGQAQGQFANAAQQQGYTQDVGSKQFFNQAQQQSATDRLRAADHANQVSSQRFDLANTETANQQTLRQQALQEEIALRNQPISEISALLNGSQPTLPQFQPFQAGHVADTPVGQYIYQSAQMENQANNAAMGGMFGLGSSLLSALPALFSDERLKENIEQVGKSDKKRGGLPIFSYNYRGDPTPRIGFMADQVEKVHPEAVSTHESGYKQVRYDLATEPV